VRRLILAIICLPAVVLAQTERAKVPDDPAQNRVETTLKQIYKIEYAYANPADRRAFARKLQQQSQDPKSDIATKFVLLREARDVAASAGDVQLALRIVEDMDRSFVIAAREHKATVLNLASRSIDSVESAAVYISAGIALMQEYSSVGDYAAAGKLAHPITTMAAQTRNPHIISGVRNRISQLRDAQVEYDKIKLAMNRPSPNDTNGDLAAGKFACFFKDDWQYGLGRLSTCVDAKLRETAKRDLDVPKTAADRLALANAWWDLAQKQPAHARLRLEARARQWYRLAANELGGLDKAMAEKRIAASLGAPEDAVVFDGHAYAHSPVATSWHEAKLTCELLGGHLVCVESKEEWQFLLDSFKKDTAWMGGCDEDEEGKWRWVTGVPWKYTAWWRRQPDNAHGGQHYLVFNSSGWDDIGKAGRHGFVCEWE
jgi:hypothetical protein